VAGRARSPAPRAASPPLVARVFGELADGAFHSGEALAKSLRVSRSAVWKAVRALRGLGATLEAVRNRGYRLENASAPLDAREIREQIVREARIRIARLDTVWSIGSTNTALLARANPANGASEVLLAEYQTAGRGRRGRSWVAPPGGAICLSLSWTFREVPPDLSALGLVIGVAALEALKDSALAGLALKWPNDLLHGERKLGGVLIDLRAESEGPACVVVGVGLNVAVGERLLRKIAASGVAPTDLRSAGLPAPSRNALAARLIGECIRGLLAFEREGLGPFIERWREADALHGRAVEVRTPEGSFPGIARGIDMHGALIVEARGGLKRFISGDVTVRPAG
jgi:BirA family biotin operon repressor/biotin-[acetyl-CoA-carboxylase] ligase